MSSGPAGGKPEDVGAGTGVPGVDLGEEAAPATVGAEEGGSTDVTSDESTWAGAAGEALEEEGASAGELRDEPSEPSQ